MVITNDYLLLQIIYHSILEVMKSNFSVLIKVVGGIVSFHAISILVQILNNSIISLFLICIVLVIYILITVYIYRRLQWNFLCNLNDSLKSILPIAMGFMLLNSFTGGLPKSVIDKLLHNTINPIYCEIIQPQYKAYTIAIYSNEDDKVNKPSNEYEVDGWTEPNRTNRFIVSNKNHISHNRNNTDVSISHFITWQIPYSMGFDYKEKEKNIVTYYAFYPFFLLYECLFLSTPYIILVSIIYLIRLIYQRFKNQYKLSEQL